MAIENNAAGTDLLENTTFSQLLSSGPGPLDDPPAPTPEETAAAEAAATEKAATEAAAAEAAAKANEGKTPEEIAAAEAATTAATEKAAEEAANVEKGLNPDGTKKTTDSDPDSGKPGDGDDPTIIELVQTSLGYDVDGQFDNSVDGVTDYVKQAIPVAAKEMVNQIFEEYPEAKNLIDHLAKGNSLETFMEESKVPDYFTMEVNDTDENIQVQREIMKAQFENAGVEDADSLISNLEENGKLQASAASALEKMQSQYKNVIEAKKEQEIAQAAAQAEAAKKQWNEVKSMVDTGQLGTIKIPASKQGAFWDYLTKPIDNKNTTLRANKNMSLTLEQRMMLEYMVFSEFKIAGSKKVAQDLAALADANNKREARLKGTGSGGRQDDDLNDKKSLESLTGLNFKDLLTPNK